MRPNLEYLQAALENPSFHHYYVAPLLFQVIHSK